MFEKSKHNLKDNWDLTWNNNNKEKKTCKTNYKEENNITTNDKIKIRSYS